jgi:hypothetical protein
MPEIFDAELNAMLTVDEANRVRSINQVAFRFSGAASARQSALTYLREVAGTLNVPLDQVEYAHQHVSDWNPLSRGTEFRLSEEKSFFDSTTVGFCQTHLNIPLWDAGITVTVKHNPMRVVNLVNTSIDGVSAALPSRAAVNQWRGLFQRAAVEKTAARVGARTRRSGSADFIARMLSGGAFRRGAPSRIAIQRDRGESGRILSGRFFVYRYSPDERLHRTEEGIGEPIAPEESGAPGRTARDGNAWEASRVVEPALPLPTVDPRIRPGGDYVVAEVVFLYPTKEWGAINWRALVEVTTGSILYLRPLAAAVNGLVFVHDPITANGNAALGPDKTDDDLNPHRRSETLRNLHAPYGATQSLAGRFVTISEKGAPPVLAPTQSLTSNFDYHVRTNDFAAVNAYYHVNRFFELVEDLGFPIQTYFNGTTFPIPVDHRGLGNNIGAVCVGNGSGIDHLRYGLAHVGDTANPIGIAVDWRVHLHELGGHGILWDHVGKATFGFAHSAGDSLAAILSDPESKAPTNPPHVAPFVVPGPGERRYERPVKLWAWNGPNDYQNYHSEEILTTTLFRVYRSIGGGSPDVDRKRLAARYMAYLLLRTVSTLTAATNPATALAFAESMIAADRLNWTHAGLTGGAYGKVIRWSFEKQGLYQAGNPAPHTVNTAGRPPAVDVYIDDGRHGEYEYTAVHWNTTTIWNRSRPDGLTGHQNPVPGNTNYAYVKIKNRGTAVANNVIVRGYHTMPGAGLLWPDDFEPLATAQLSAGSLGANNTQEKTVGPFQWTPTTAADGLFMIVSDPNDPSNVDNLTPGEGFEEWRLVPNDNNVGLRRVQVVSAGNGSAGLIAGMHGSPFWVGNPDPTISVATQLPRILADRGWRIGFRDLPDNRFVLDSRQRRELIIELAHGEEFDRADVEATIDRDIVVTVSANGGAIGGMTYRLEPEMSHPPNTRMTKPSSQ